MDMEKPSHNKSNRLGPRSVLAAITVLGVLSAAVYLINFRIHGLIPAFSALSGIQLYVIMFLFLSVLYLAGVVLVLKTIPKEATSWGLILMIVLSSVFFRISLVPSEPTVLSKDIYRFIWDGRVQLKGINPYRYPPGAEELKDLRDDQIYPNINRKESPTLYPAGAQIFFRLVHLVVGNSIAGFKGIMVFFDILAVLLLMALLKKQGINRSHIIIYAWNPLVIFEIAYSGHLEGLTVFLMVAALYLAAIHRKLPGIVMLAFSAAVKMYPALLLAAFLNRGNRIKGLVTFFVTILVLYLPFLGAGSKISGFLPVYLKNPYESFNLGLKYLLMRLLPGLDYYLLSLLFILFLASVGLVVFFKNKKDPDISWYAYILTGWLMILMPASLHPWYVILIIPFVAIYPGAAWLIFSCTVTLSYLKYTSPQGIMPTWILLVEYLPLFALLIAGYIFRGYNRRHKRSGMGFSRKKEQMVRV
jgi:hypothetical protein